MLQVSKESHAAAHISPHVREGEYRLAALLAELLDSVFLNILLSAHAQVFLNLNFNRQSVRVPACLRLNLESLHYLISGNRILQGAGHHVVNARLAVCCRRTLIENERLCVLSLLYTAVQEVFILPFLHLLLLNLSHRLI